MKKVAFVHSTFQERIGVMLLAALFKQQGYDCRVFILGDNTAPMLRAVCEYQPDILGLSSYTSEADLLLAFARQCRERLPGVFIVMGGFHPTVFPDVIKDPVLDATFRGEAERVIAPFCASFERGLNDLRIPGFYFKRGGQIIRNELAPLADLDANPFPDRSIYYDHYPALRNIQRRFFQFNRGCPYNCSYCQNNIMRRLFKQQKWIRIRDPQSCIREVLEVKEKYGLEYINLIDSMMNLDKAWLKEAGTLFRQHNIPFLGTFRVDAADEETIKILADSGVPKINLSVECGNEEYRAKVFKRKASNAKILQVATWLRKYGVRYWVANIVGNPGETVAMAMETVRLNRALKAERSACHILQPFHGTELYDYCVEHGYLDPGDLHIYNTIDTWQNPDGIGHSPLKQANINELINIQNFFFWLVKFPILEKPLLLLAKLPTNRCFTFIQQIPWLRLKLRYASGWEERKQALAEIVFFKHRKRAAQVAAAPPVSAEERAS